MRQPVPDVVVVGAGIIGSSIAWTLARRGVDVVLLDAGRIGGEASTAGAGMLAPGGEAGEDFELAVSMIDSRQRYGSFVAALAEESGVPIDLRECGAVELAFSDAEFEHLVNRAARQREFGIPSSPLTREEWNELAPGAGAGVAGALYFPGDAVVNPLDMMEAFRRIHARRAKERSRAVRIVLGRESAEVVTLQNGRYLASTVVLAAGAWSSAIEIKGEQAPPGFPDAFPVKGHLLGYQRPEGSLGPILRSGHTYVLQRRGGFTIAGASTEHVGFDRTIDQGVAREIAERAGRVFAPLSGLAPSECWIGFRPACSEGRPMVARSGQSRLWLAYGHYRNGILLAPGTAEQVAGSIISSLGRD
ncbi:MAG: NAD(P)/FAD-dependent oxidoreductase [Bryobacteraceae bacterium]